MDPSKFSPGILTSFMTSSAVWEDRKPIFFSTLPMDSPGEAPGTMKAEMPLAPFVLSALAKTV
jgi:hypothetical protein